MIGIIDYGLGNVKAFENVYHKLNIDVKIIKNENQLFGVDKVILPGVGAFDYAMQKLEMSGMKNKLTNLVQIGQMPVLGICVGMQMLASRSEEGILPGLGWIDGVVKKFNNELRVPHMGWNDIFIKETNPLLKNLETGARFYFLHSYYFETTNNLDTIATTKYSIEFASSINKKNVYGVQFHPEKSHHWGIQLLKNFAEL